MPVVALNVQTKDFPLAVYDSLFRGNGITGFTLKPSMLLEKSGSCYLVPNRRIFRGLHTNDSMVSIYCFKILQQIPTIELLSNDCFLQVKCAK